MKTHSRDLLLPLLTEAMHRLPLTMVYTITMQYDFFFFPLSFTYSGSQGDPNRLL